MPGKRKWAEEEHKWIKQGNGYGLGLKPLQGAKTMNNVELPEGAPYQSITFIFGFVD